MSAFAADAGAFAALGGQDVGVAGVGVAPGKAFGAAYGAKVPKAAAKITDDVEELLPSTKPPK